MTPTQKLVKKTEVRPCGCRVVIYVDDTMDVDMCIACCIGNAGQMLMHAGQKLAAMQAQAQMPKMAKLP
jgi:hypothetical protein